jgi:hypothetical protein
MAQSLCIKCGSELKVSSYCQLCQDKKTRVVAFNDLYVVIAIERLASI